MIAGFEYPTDGAILLEGRDIASLPPFKRPVNTVFQNYALFPHLTVAENIAFGLEMLGRPRAEIEARVAEMLRLVRMETLAARRTDQISGGQQQRVALARALAPQPRVLLLDEPLSALDYKLRKEMQIELKRLQHETGITFIFVTHDQEEALSMSDRIAVMSKGHVLQIGAPREIYEHPADRFVAAFIGESNFLDGTVAAADDRTAEIRLDAGPPIRASLRAGTAPAGRVTVAVRPENTVLVDPGAPGALLEGTMEAMLYTGADTRFHVRLRDGTIVMACAHNRPDESRPPDPGAPVGVVFREGSAQVLGA
jgi:spermidine/putrescine transport system ATP-binding protein